MMCYYLNVQFQGQRVKPRKVFQMNGRFMYMICEIFQTNKFCFGVAIGPSSFASRSCRLGIFLYIISRLDHLLTLYWATLSNANPTWNYCKVILVSIFLPVLWNPGYFYHLYLGSDRTQCEADYRCNNMSLARPDWKNIWKVAIFRPTRSLLPRRPGWTDNLLNFFFLSGLQKLEFGRCSLFPSCSG